ncbi:TlpA disulfide reductase family protein [Brevibacterium spongiae]|uniref:TlpA family protein disulfide reductase n=1 Tax=Brevibacterium spongiae TaxID=2909672 RepID=A0ABY5SM18_9MICO|nr:TlpA disulfide reductase family protein [Brevibacterium spongiae]UVI35597.1 TlpA family protein disulfide reductase [Brevibacterium spongiae]
MRHAHPSRSRTHSFVRITYFSTVLATLGGCTPAKPAEKGIEDNFAANDQGYLSGAGVITQVPEADRAGAVELSGETTNGQSFDLEDWRGSPVVLNLWYAACPSCREEASDLQDSFTSFSDEGVRFLGINVRDEAAAANAFARQFGITYPLDAGKEGKAVAALSGLLPPRAVPSTVVLGSTGAAAARVVGAVDRSTLNALISDVLDEEASTL